MPKSLLRLVAFTAMAVLLAILPVQSAWAHAQLLSTDPIENAVLAEPPTQLQLHFNEPVTPLAIALVGADGSSQDLLDAASAGASVSVVLPADLADGTRVLSWRVVSTDGHPIAGALVFSIGSVSGAAPVPVANDGAVGLVL
jgi:copper transport protein